MTNLQCKGAAVEMIRYLQEMDDAYKSGEGKYRTVSARSVLADIGITGADADDVIRFIGSDGFDYCLDPIVPSTSWGENPDHPSAGVCYWGHDQLLSRLHCLHSVPSYVI